MALFCGLLATSIAGDGIPAHHAAAARCALATLLLLVAAASLAPRRKQGRRVGLGPAGASLIAAAVLAFVAGTIELWLAMPGRHPSYWLTSLGLSPAAWAAARPLGFELSGLLAVLALCAGHAHALAEQRAASWQLSSGRPAGAASELNFLDVAGRALSVAALAFAAFAVVLHALLGAGPLGPAALLAPIAVLAGSSLSAFWLAPPAARAIALARARAAGILVRDPGALERVARADVVCIEADHALAADAGLAVRALRELGVSVHLLSERRTDAVKMIAAWIGARAFGPLTPANQALHVRDLQHAGAWVLLVGAGDGEGAARADVAVAVAPPGARCRDALGQAPLVLGVARLEPLAYLVELSRALRARLREGAILAALYNAVLIPCAALGWCPPAAAALLALVEALLVLANAARLPSWPRTARVSAVLRPAAPAPAPARSGAR